MRSRFTLSVPRRQTTSTLRSGVGALMERESTLLWLLNSCASDVRTKEQSEIVSGIIAALQQCVASLPVPERFDFFKNVVRRAESREVQPPSELRPTRRDLIRRHRTLEADWNALKAQWGGHRAWASTLKHASAAHAQMAYALFVDARQGAA